MYRCDDEVEKPELNDYEDIETDLTEDEEEDPDDGSDDDLDDTDEIISEDIEPES